MNGMVYTYISVEVDEPVEGILIHRINVGHIRNGEEQHTAMFGNLKGQIMVTSNTQAKQYSNVD